MSAEPPLSAESTYRITVRFGDAVLQAGHTAIPNLVLNHYGQLGISAAEMMFCIHVWQYWWTEKDPYPSLSAVASKMSVTRRQVRNYASSLKAKGFVAVHDRHVEGLGQVSSEYDFSPLIQAVVKLFQSNQPPRNDPSHGGRKNLSQGGGKDISQAPRNAISPEEYKEEEYESGVVVWADRLTKLGVSRGVATQLARRFEPAYIEAKIDLVGFLMETNPQALGKNPAGFLRRAIEEDYEPPADYLTPDERHALAEQEAARQAAADATWRAQEEKRTREQERERASKAKALAVIRGEHPPEKIPGTDLTPDTCWRMVLQKLQNSMTAANYQTWLAETALVSCDASEAVVVGPSTFVVEWLATRFRFLIERQLEDVLGYRVETRYLALSELHLEAGSAGAPAPAD